MLLGCISARFWVSGFKVKSVPLYIHFLVRLLVITRQSCMNYTDLHSSWILQDIQAGLALLLKGKRGGKEGKKIIFVIRCNSSIKVNWGLLSSPLLYSSSLLVQFVPVWMFLSLIPCVGVVAAKRVTTQPAFTQQNSKCSVVVPSPFFLDLLTPEIGPRFLVSLPAVYHV